MLSHRQRVKKGMNSYMKHGWKQIMCLLLCAMLALPVGGLAETASASFAPGEPHTNTLDFRLWFETMSAQADGCTLSIQKKIYDEAQAGELLSRLTEDLDAIRALTGAQIQPHTVYVAEKLFCGVQRFENRVYCRAEDILSGEYLEYLVAAALGLEERWKAIGLVECLTGETEGSKLALRLYFSWSADMELLSLFPAYFTDEFTSSRERELAWQTAGWLCRFIVENYGYSALAGEVGDALKSEWLLSIGVDRAYTDPYRGALDGFSWETSTKYPLILTTQKGDTFYLTALKGDMDDSEDVRAFLYEAIVGPQQVIDGLRADAPEYAAYMQENFARPLKYYIEPDSPDYSYANWAAQEIHVGFTSSIIHETMHILTRVYATHERYYMEMWKVEGLAEYLTLKYGSSMNRKEGIFWEMTEYDTMPSEQDDERTAFLKEVVRNGYEFYREEAGGLPECAEEVDELLYSLSMAKALQLSQYDEWNSVGDAFSELNSRSVSQRFANGLTYNESLSFSDYLIRTYSLEKFLDFCMDETHFEDFYGISYEEAMEGWYIDLFGESAANEDN